MEQESRPDPPANSAGLPVEPGSPPDPSAIQSVAPEPEFPTADSGSEAETPTSSTETPNDYEYDEDPEGVAGLPAIPGYGLPAPIAVPEAPGVSASRLALISAVFALGVLLYLLVEPRQSWMLLLLVGLVTLGVDGIVRGHPRSFFTGDVAESAPYLFLPALYTLGAGLFLDDVAEGYWAVPGALIAAVLLYVFTVAEYHSVDEDHRLYPFARLLLNIGTYLTAFAFFAVVYTFDVSLVPAAAAVGIVTLLLAVEVLREAEA